MTLYQFWKRYLQKHDRKIIVKKILIEKGELLEDEIFNGYSGDIPDIFADLYVVATTFEDEDGLIMTIKVKEV